jgi:hypothetical protein
LPPPPNSWFSTLAPPPLEAPPPPALELVARTELALTLPSLCWVPWTTTVSPGCTLFTLPLIVRVTLAPCGTVTFTVFPWAVVT